MPKKEKAEKSEQLAALVAATKDINGKIKLSQPIPVGAKVDQIVEAIKAEGDHPEGGFYDTDKLSAETVTTLATIGVEIKTKGPATKEPAVAPKKNGRVSKTAPAAKAEKPAKAVKVKAEKQPRQPSPYGSAIDSMTSSPDQTKAQLLAKMLKKGFDADKNEAAVATAYSVVRSIISKLRENGLMKKA